ncbi:hypothetical protein SK128_028199 [Halocaridina rubra]|uniref:Uncharacterized protein n=1 Tax=Halocaridina rubra TaxID=373956 RepID=A0AAN8WV00_HALRR
MSQAFEEPPSNPYTSTPLVPEPHLSRTSIISKHYQSHCSRPTPLKNLHHIKALSFSLFQSYAFEEPPSSPSIIIPLVPEPRR